MVKGQKLYGVLSGPVGPPPVGKVGEVSIEMARMEDQTVNPPVTGQLP